MINRLKTIGGNVMTEDQKENIIRLRYCGWGYRTIDTAVNLSRDAVRNYCKATWIRWMGR